AKNNLPHVRFQGGYLIRECRCQSCDFLLKVQRQKETEQLSLRVRIQMDDENSQKPLWRPMQSTLFWGGQLVCKG
ncbi:MAG: hypothetical protein VXY07_01720, partial [Planctomycetota bacterium]|nr:hypothetical protein [Planctomycetota bacterium]